MSTPQRFPQNPQPKWGPFERAPEESLRRAKAQIKAVKEQTQESSRGKSDEENLSDWPIHETFFPPPGELSRLMAESSVPINPTLSKELAALWAEAHR